MLCAWWRSVSLCSGYRHSLKWKAGWTFPAPNDLDLLSDSDGVSAPLCCCSRGGGGSECNQGSRQRGAFPGHQPGGAAAALLVRCGTHCVWLGLQVTSPAPPRCCCTHIGSCEPVSGGSVSSVSPEREGQGAWGCGEVALLFTSRFFP